MRFFADECCSANVVAALRADGHDVVYAAESFASEPDTVILQRAYDEERVLLTEDRDFGELVFRLRLPARGILYLRFDVTEHEEKVARLRTLVAHTADQLLGAFVVLQPDRTRIRPLQA